MRPAPYPIMIAALLAASCPGARAGAVEDGEEALRRGNYASAQRFFKIAIQADPDDSRAWSGYSAAARAAAKADAGGPAARPPTPAAPPPAGAPVAEVVAGPAQPAEAATGGETATEYLRGKPIFYSEGLKGLFGGRRLREARVAERSYEQEKEALTRYYSRKHGGRLAIAATLFTPRLYTYLACLRATKNKLGKSGAEEVWLSEADRSFRLLEFYLVLRNLTYKGGINSNLKLVDIDGLKERIYLEDDRGLRYRPYKIEGFGTPTIKEATDGTVWFAPINRDGKPIWETAVSEMRLVLEEIPGEARRVVFPFKKSVFRRMVQVQ